MKNNILFNALLYEPYGAGISRYTKKLVECFLKKNYPIDIILRNDFRDLYGDKANILYYKSFIKNSKDRIVAEQWKLRNIYSNYDLVHFPDHATPVFNRCTRIATIHDLSMISKREMRTVGQNVVKNIMLQNTVRRSSAFICDSLFTKRELNKYFPKTINNSYVVHLGVEKPIVEDNIDVLYKYNLTEQQYVLCVGTLSPHKNIAMLLKAYSLIDKFEFKIKLVLVGNVGWMCTEIFQLLHNLNLTNSVIMTGYVSQENLECLYKNSKALIFASLYEGFGLPLLEAMVRGIPVIASNIPVFKEIGDDSVVYFDPFDENDMAEKILNVLSDDALKKAMVEKGLERVKLFSWEKCAEETMKVYESVL